MEGRNPMEVVGWLGRMGHHTVIDHKAKAAAEMKNKPHAYRLEIKLTDGSLAGITYTTETVVYVARSEKEAIKKALLRPRAKEATVLETFTKEEYHRCFGVPHRGGKEWG